MTATVLSPGVARAAPPRRNLIDNPWLGFAVRRGRRLLVSLWVLVTASFLMLQLVPGDPVRSALGPSVPQVIVEQRREQLGLNDPLWQQYLNYFVRLFTGDLGESLVTGIPVARTIAERLPATIEITVLAFLTAIVVAIPLGVVMAALTRGGRRRRTELAFTSTTTAIAAIPDFLIAVALVFIFGVTFHLLPVAGRGGPASYVIPVIGLSAATTSFLARLMRVEMLSVLSADYIRTARAKRLPAWMIYLKHALPNAITTTLTVSGLMLGGLLAGTVLVENVLSWPGLGNAMVASILSKDYPVAQGAILVYGVIILAINLAVDVLIAVLDPRSSIRES